MYNNELGSRMNNDERPNSSLSSSVNERAMEHQGNQLQGSKDRLSSMPQTSPSSSISSGGQGGSVSKSSGGLASKGGLPAKEGIAGGQGLPKKEGISGSKGSNNGSFPPGRLGNMAHGVRDQAASAALQYFGVPKPIGDMAVKSKLGQKALDRAMYMGNPALAAAKGIADGAKKVKDEVDKTGEDKEAEEQEQEKRGGSVTLRMPRTAKLVIFLAILPTFTFVLFFFAIIVSYIADEKAVNIFFANLTSGGQLEGVYEIHKGVTGSGPGEVGMGAGNPTYNEFLSRYQNLGNLYEYFKCEDEDECLKRDEVKFYIKVNDITLRYKKKYNVRLEWKYLMSAALSVGLDVKDVFKLFIHNYNYADVEQYNILMDLDWDYDYKTIPGYTYLDADNYRYDLQILAKNMVTKTTTQTCTKTVKNKDGTTSTVVTKQRTDTDIEDQYLEPGQPYYLQCDSGETYSISSNYRYDEGKFLEFLLEYLEHKMYLKGTGNAGEYSDDFLPPSLEKGEYIFPLPSGATRCRSSAYGYRIHPITKKPNNHSGDDYPAAAGTPVYAVRDGVVKRAGFDSSMGNHVYIDHGNGVTSVYMHASKLYVKVGDHVKQGDVIMAVGTTGSSTGNHLHITFKLNGTNVNPANYIGALPMC